MLFSTKSLVFLVVAGFSLLDAASIGDVSPQNTTTANTRPNHCENIVCQEGFHCDPNYKCTRIPCVPQCIENGVRTDCHENEELNDCGNGCEPTCENENPVCPMICGPASCKCQAGFVREPMGRCIKRAQCPMAGLPRPRKPSRGQPRN